MSQASPQSLAETKLKEAKKLFDDLNLIFIKNPEINEIGFIISSKDYDKTSTENQPFIILDNKLGLSFQWITQLYSYAFTYFIELKTHFDNVDKFKQLPSERHRQLLVNELIQTTRNILLINAENLTALNTRKKLINLNFIKHQDEIKLLNLIFTKHPKSGEGWAHRKWVITNYTKSIKDINQHDHVPLFLDHDIELSVCKRVAEIYPKNYYAWTHRWWILKNNNCSIDVMLKDLEFVQDWIKRNISDYCGYHHRYLILTHLFNKCYNNIANVGSGSSSGDNETTSTTTTTALEEDSNEMKIHKLWDDEFHFIHKIITLYPGHESAWSYKRVLTLFWLENASKIVYDNSISTTLPLTSILKESEFVDSILEEVDSSYYEKQKSFAQRYLLSIYELKFTIFKESGDFSMDLETVKNNFNLLIEDLKISLPNQSIVWDYKFNKFLN